MSLKAGRLSVSDEIWYLSFEALEDWGSGLSTYCRNVIRAASEKSRPIRLFVIRSDEANASRKSAPGLEMIYVSDKMSEKLRPLGYWMNLSLAFADAVCAELERVGIPKAIEIPDGFGIGYFLLQRKLTGHPLLQSVPILLTAHTPIRVIEEWNSREVNSLPNWWIYRAEKWCYRAADSVIVLSGMLENVLRERGYIDPSQRVFRSTNPYFQAGVTPQRNRSEILTVGMASRMVNWKGLREALLLARAAEERGKPFRLELCGLSSPDFVRAQNDFRDVFDSGTATYLGTLSQQDLESRRSRWICQIHPSHFDNFPYSVVEALVSGLPCLVGPGNGVAEALDPATRDRLVVDFSKPQNVLEFIDAISDMEQILSKKDFSEFGADAYFDGRDRMIADLANMSAVRRNFPFIDMDQARTGLRPTAPIPVSDTGARLTVVVPYYNMAAYVDACISSIRNSTAMTDIVLVNDGSTDPASVTKLDEYRDDRRIRVLDIPNGGVARARNYGVEQARTEFVALLDADDTVEPDYYSKALTVLDCYDNVGFVGCWANDFRDATGETIRYWPTFNAEPLPNIVINNTNCQALIYRRNLYLEAGRHDPDLKMYLDDWDGMLGMLEGGYFGVMLPEALFNYRQRAGSIFSSGRDAWNVHYSYIVNKRSVLVKRNAQEALLFCNANGPNRDYHLLGWTSPVNFGSTAPKKGGRLKTPHRLARSFAKRLLRFSEKGYRQ